MQALSRHSEYVDGGGASEPAANVEIVVPAQMRAQMENLMSELTDLSKESGMTEERNLEQGAQAQSAALPATQQLLAQARTELGRVIAGQGEVIGEVLVAVLTQGHALLEGVPGIAKTLIVKSVGRLLGLGFQRVQGTPDLMPADILGTTIFRPGTDTFTFHAGPVFTDLLLVDEINRMPPRTQAALLECMEERQVTSDGVRRPLPRLVHRLRDRESRSTLKARIRCPRRSSTAFC